MNQDKDPEKIEMDHLGCSPTIASETKNCVSPNILITAEDDRKVPRKIDLWILPIMAFTYMLQFLDKMTLSNASIMGIIEDTGLVGSEYSWCSSIFYFGYFIGTCPVSYLTSRLPLGKYLSITVALWGIVLMCHAACNDFHALMAARFFLGFSEAAVAPGFTLIVSMFYKRQEQPIRQNAWMAGNGIGNVTNGIIAFGISTITDAGLAPWRLLYLIYGSITVVHALVLTIILPSSPATATFLKPHEQEIAVQRVVENNTGVLDERTFKPRQALKALYDPQIWLMFLYFFATNLTNAIGSFSSLIIASFGYSTLNTLLLTTPAGGLQLILLAITGIVTLKFENKRNMLTILLTLLSLVGGIMIYVLPGQARVARLIGVYLAISYTMTIPLVLSLVSSNIAGFTKRATGSSMLFVAYAAGNIVGPQFFIPGETPAYKTGYRLIISSLSLATFFSAILWAYYIMENKRRDQRFREMGDTNDSEGRGEELSDLTDLEIHNFRYVT